MELVAAAAELVVLPVGLADTAVVWAVEAAAEAAAKTTEAVVAVAGLVVLMVGLAVVAAIPFGTQKKD